MGVVCFEYTVITKKNLMYSLLTCKYDLVSIKNNSFKLLYLKIVINRNWKMTIIKMILNVNTFKNITK